MLGRVKHFWGSLLVGLVLLGGLVAFALMPGAGADEPEEPDGPVPAVVTLDATQTACRTFRVGRAQAKLDRALSNLSQALQFEKTPGDHMSFYDWIEADTVSRSLLDTADAAAAAAGLPGLPDEAFDAFGQVVQGATDLEYAAISSDMMNTQEIDGALAQLSGGLAAVGDVCG